MEDVFHFVIFIITFAVILPQFVLSMLLDRPSADRYIKDDDVRELPFYTAKHVHVCGMS